MINKALLTLLILLSALPLRAYSAELGDFSAAKTPKEQKIARFALNQMDGKGNLTPADILLKPTDLNDDFINEYVLTTSNQNVCSKMQRCPYQIIALSEGEPLLLGQFDAHKILISDKKTYGVRSIIVYNDPYNDFKSQTAIWNPFNSRFELP